MGSECCFCELQAANTLTSHRLTDLWHTRCMNSGILQKHRHWCRNKSTNNGKKLNFILNALRHKKSKCHMSQLFKYRCFFQQDISYWRKYFQFRKSLAFKNRSNVRLLGNQILFVIRRSFVLNVTASPFKKC